MKINNKTFLFFGLLFILLSFGCVAGVLRQIFNEHQQKVQEIEVVKKRAAGIGREKASAERKVQELAQRVGQEIALDRLIAVAEREYGESERDRKKGDLWVDREGGNWMVTLGALNGIKKGSRLNVLDQGEHVGVVVAETVLDVVSYVFPLGDARQFQNDIYQVSVE